MPFLSPESAAHPRADLELPAAIMSLVVTVRQLKINCRTVTTTLLINHWTICQNRSKCACCRLNLLHTPEPILNCLGRSWVWWWKFGSQRSTAELSPPHCWLTTEPSAKIAANALAVAWICYTPLTWSWTAWGDHESGRDRSAVKDQLQNCHHHTVDQPLNHLPKSQQMPFPSPESAAHPRADLELTGAIMSLVVTVRQLKINCRTVTTTLLINHWTICQNRSKCACCRLNLLHTPEPILNCLGRSWVWSWQVGSQRSTAELSPPHCWLTTEPSAKIAANALAVAGICCTPLSWSWTAELSLPNYAPPQVTIVLSPWHHKAKAILVAASCGWSTRTVRHCPSFLCDSSKVCSKLTKTRFSPVIILRCFCPKARWAAILRSRTEEDGKSDRSS